MGENTQINNPKMTPHIAIREEKFSKASGISTNDRRNMPNKIPGNNKIKKNLCQTLNLWILLISMVLFVTS